MKSSWAQPSLSRDFALLSAAIFFALCLISAWVIYSTSDMHRREITSELEKESVRIERTLASEMDNANYMLTSLGRQIVLDSDRNPVRIAQLLKSFDSKGYIYTTFSWIDPQQQIIASSNKGVLDKPVDISDRDYVKKAQADPWKMTIGKPIEGRVSAHWVIPVGMGLSDYTGKFIGSLLISIDISTLTNRISTLVKRDGISFAIVSKTLLPLAQVSDDKNFMNNNFPAQKLSDINFAQSPSGLIAESKMLWSSGNYAYYRMSQDYPYIILLGYDSHTSDQSVRTLLWSRLLQVVCMAMFFVLFLWIVRSRVIRPVLDMTDIATSVGRGEPYCALPQAGPVEIRHLASQIQHVSNYISETKHVQDELRNKIFLLRKAKERADMDMRSKNDFLAYACQEMRTGLNNIIGFAQVMKDQLYGPIENRKYRQYNADIYTDGTRLLETVQDLLTLARADTGMIPLQTKPVDISEAINSSLRLLSDKLQAEKYQVKTQLPDPAPKLMADEFRLQQLLSNLLLFALSRAPAASTLLCEARMLNENKEKPSLVLLIGPADTVITSVDILALATQKKPAPRTASTGGDETDHDIRLELAKTLATLQGGSLDVIYATGNQLKAIVLQFDAKTIAD